MTCSGRLTRGRRPNTTMMSQNSQVNGQPREICMPPYRYSCIGSRSKRGVGTVAMSVFAACS
jgi:hypothetical protein